MDKEVKALVKKVLDYKKKAADALANKNYRVYENSCSKVYDIEWNVCKEHGRCFGMVFSLYLDQMENGKEFIEVPSIKKMQEYDEDVIGTFRKYDVKEFILTDYRMTAVDDARDFLRADWKVQKIELSDELGTYYNYKITMA